MLVCCLVADRRISLEAKETAHFVLRPVPHERQDVAGCRVFQERVHKVKQHGHDQERVHDSDEPPELFHGGD